MCRTYMSLAFSGILPKIRNCTLFVAAVVVVNIFFLNILDVHVSLYRMKRGKMYNVTTSSKLSLLYK